jgi:hypothetical protein
MNGTLAPFGFRGVFVFLVGVAEFVAICFEILPLTTLHVLIGKA